MGKKILIFSVAYRPFIGGAEVAVEELTKRLILAGFSFDLLTVNLDGRQKRQENIGEVNVFRIGKGTLGKFLFPFRAFLAARKLHQKNHYDAIWSIMANYAGFAGLFFKIFNPRIPFVLNLQEGDPIPEIKRKVWPIYPLFKMIFRRADKVTAISNYLAEWGREMGAKNVKVVPNGVTTEAFRVKGSGSREKKIEELGWGKNDRVLVTTSRLVKKNNIGAVIEAMKFLPENVKFLIVGTGGLEESLKLKVKGLKLEKRVKFVGFISQEKLPEYLWASDIFIRPSLSEGLGVSFIEAMAAGLPIISSPVGGIPDFLFPPQDNVKTFQHSQECENVPSGLFCDPNNPKDIAEKIQKLLSDNSLREKIIANASQLVAKKYDWDLIAEKMRRIFTEI